MGLVRMTASPSDAAQALAALAAFLRARARRRRSLFLCRLIFCLLLLRAMGFLRIQVGREGSGNESDVLQRNRVSYAGGVRVEGGLGESRRARNLGGMDRVGPDRPSALRRRGLCE